MPFAWRQFEPTKVGQVEKYDIPLNDWLGIKFGEGLSYGLGRAVWDRGEDFAWDTGEKVAPAILNESFAIDGYLEFTEPTTTGRAFLMRERKLEELERMKLLDSASHSASSKKAFAGFIAGIAGGFANPVDLGTSFIPFVGSAAKASQVAKLGRGLAAAQKYGRFRQAVQAGRAAIARGVVTQEAIGAGRGAQLSAAMIDGVLSQAAVEIPIAIQKARNQAEYGAQDSLVNIIAGGVFAGGLNLAGQALEAAIKRAAEFHSSFSPETKEHLIRVFEDAIIRNETADAANIIRVDEASIRAKLEAEKFDEVKARQEALREEPVVLSPPGQKPVAGPNEILYLIQREVTQSKGKPAGTIADRLFQRFMDGERTHALFSQMAEFVDRQYDPRFTGPQESYFIERVFGGERAKKVGELNAKLKQIRTELFKVREQKAAIERTRKEIRAGRPTAGGEAVPEIDVLRKGLEPLTAKEAQLKKLLDEIEGKLTGDKLEAKRKELLGDLAGVQEKIAEQQRRIQIENERVPEKFENLNKEDKLLTAREKELVAALKVGAGFKAPKPLDPIEVDVHAKAEGDARIKQEEIDRQRIAEEREKRIAELIEKKRQEWRDGLEGRISKEKEAEIKRQQEQGKLLSQEDLARYQSKADADRADLELVKQDVENLQKELNEKIESGQLSDAERRLYQQGLADLQGETAHFEPKESAEATGGVVRKMLRESRLSKYLTVDPQSPNTGIFNVGKWIDDIDLSEVDESIKVLLKSIKGKIDIDVKVTIDRSPGHQGAYTVNPFTDKGAIEIFAKSTDNKFVSESFFNRVLAHELMHRIVTSKLPYSPQQKELYQLFLHAKKIANEKGAGKMYGFKNLDEFIAEAFTSRKMREFLMQLESPLARDAVDSANAGKSMRDIIDSAWGGFVRIVRSILGLSPNSNADSIPMSVLDDVIVLSESVSKNERKIAVPFYEHGIRIETTGMMRTFKQETGLYRGVEWSPIPVESLSRSLPCISR